MNGGSARAESLGLTRSVNGAVRVFSILFDHPIRSYQHVGRNAHTDLLGRFEIDDELKLRRLFYGQVGRLCRWHRLNRWV